MGRTAAFKKEQERLKADMVVIGGGGSGLFAAVTAAERGVKNVIVLESRPSPGGNARHAGGVLATETPLQRHLGYNIRTEDVFKAVMNYAHWKPNATLVRDLLDLSGDTIAWLESRGMKFEILIPHYLNQQMMTFHAVGGKKRSGPAIVRTLVDSCRNLGVTILPRTAAKQLKTGKDGRIVGVAAESGKKEIQIDTRCVIIATGGFAGNKAMLKKYLPFYHDEMVLVGQAHKGDGIRMVEDIGAATGGIIALEAEGPAYVKSKHIMVMAKRPSTLWVNRLGQRFAVEDGLSFNEAANAIYDQPGKVAFTLFDETIKVHNIQQTLDPFEQRAIDPSTWRHDTEKVLAGHVEAGNVMRAKALSEIASWIGSDPKTLDQTVRIYNQSCEQGYDSQFAKDRQHLIPLKTPPYYAIPTNIQLLVTHGGIRINSDLQVLDQDDRPIVGCYAAGDDTNGRMGDTYNIRMSGLSMCFALGSGRLAGKRAAAFIREKPVA